MRCVACDHDSKKKDRKVATQCPNCGHKFALDPKVDGVADGFMKQAVAAVSSNGNYKYLRAQLDYEVWRRSQPPTFKQKLYNYRLVLGAHVAGLMITAYLANSRSDAGAVAFAVVGLTTLWLWTILFGPASAASRK